MTQPPDPNNQQPNMGGPPPDAGQPNMAPPPQEAQPNMAPPPQATQPNVDGPPPQEAQPNMGGLPPQAGYYPPAPPVPVSAYGQPAYTAIPGMYFDQASGLQLPNGVELASVGRRIGSWFLAIPLVIVTLGIGYIIWGLIVWANGQTPALQVLGMRCWRTETNRVAGWGYMALREVVGGFVEGILSIITELLSFIFMVTRPDRRNIKDLIAGTVVLHDPAKVLASAPKQ
jgi:uncharacterized RDD family membrane protein YckC